MLGMARMGKQQSAAQLSVRTVRQGLSKPIIGKTIAVGLTLSLLHLDLAPALEAKRVLEPIAPKRVELPSLPKPSLFAMLGHGLEQITVQPAEQPPLPPAPGFAPAWGASASVYGGSVNLGNGNLTPAAAAGRLGRRGEFRAVFQLASEPQPALADCPEVDA